MWRQGLLQEKIEPLLLSKRTSASIRIFHGMSLISVSCILLFQRSNFYNRFEVLTPKLYKKIMLILYYSLFILFNLKIAFSEMCTILLLLQVAKIFSVRYKTLFALKILGVNDSFTQEIKIQKLL